MQTYIQIAEAKAWKYQGPKKHFHGLKSLNAALFTCLHSIGKTLTFPTTETAAAAAKRMSEREKV